MTTRVLPPEEWSRLASMPLPEVRNAVTNGVVIAVEDATGEIVGSCAVFQCVHMEGVWIHPSYRSKASVGRRLLHAAREAIRGTGADGALTVVVPHSSMAKLWLDRGAIEVLGQHLLVKLV